MSFRAFQAAWRRAAGTPDASAGAIDRVLHEARVDPRTRRQIRFEAPLDDLPDGAFVLLPGGRVAPPPGPGRRPAAVAAGGLWRAAPPTIWHRLRRAHAGPTLAVLRAGYAPSLHPTAIRR